MLCSRACPRLLLGIPRTFACRLIFTAHARVSRTPDPPTANDADGVKGEAMSERRQKYLLRLAALVAGTVMPVAAIAAPAQAAVGDTGVSKKAQKYVVDQAGDVGAEDACSWGRFGEFVQCEVNITNPGRQLPDLNLTLREVTR
jgi:hypothetical protein